MAQTDTAISADSFTVLPNGPSGMENIDRLSVDADDSDSGPPGSPSPIKPAINDTINILIFGSGFTPTTQPMITLAGVGTSVAVQNVDFTMIGNEQVIIATIDRPDVRMDLDVTFTDQPPPIAPLVDPPSRIGRISINVDTTTDKANGFRKKKRLNSKQTIPERKR
jgi:hypothetical protein